MSQLSAAAQQLFDALPLDGEKRGNVGLSEELALGANDYALAQDELLEMGLVEFGRGGSVGRRNEATRDPLSTEVSEVARQILNTLPQDGSRVGNISFRRDLGLSQSVYDDGKAELVRLGHVILGSGRGGSIRRKQDVDNSAAGYYSRTPLTATQAEASARAADPAEPIEETDELIMSDDSGSDDFDAVDAPQADERHIFSDKSDPSVHELYIRYKEGDLILQPDFQRQFVWDVIKCSRLVESAILEVPLPMIYLSEEADGREAVIDGQQRLTSFFKFLDAEYALRSLAVLSDLNGSRFVDLDRLIQNKIKRCSIRVTTIKKESSEELRFEIFERLNTGAMALNDQELRNCIYRGPYNELLRELSQGPEFRAAVGIKRVEKRMRDVELVLRFAAFFHASYLSYKPPIRRFLNDDMKRYRMISPSDEKDLRSAFKNSVAIIRSLFGEHAFRRLYRGSAEAHGGGWEKTTFSASLFDVLMYSFAHRDKNLVYRHLDEIREAFLDLMTQNDEFIETIERGTSNKSMITKRFDLWRAALDKILSGDSAETRCFTYELKQELYENDATCALCGQRIQVIDDAAVDHVEQYAHGGRTVPENARLTHRYCNWARPRND